MHLLAAQPGLVDDGTDALDLGQTPGDIVVLSAADTELAALADAQARRLEADAQAPSLRLANVMHLSHNMSVDLYVDAVVRHARLIVVRLLGGRAYWPYGVEQIAQAAMAQGIPLAVLPGDDAPDAELADWSTLPREAQHRLWQYLVQGGPANAGRFLDYAAAMIGGGKDDWLEPEPLLACGLYWTDAAVPDLESLRAQWTAGAPVAALVFYRALLQAGNLDAVDALVRSLGRAGLNALPVYVKSLKDPVSAATLEGFFADAPPAVVLNTTGFAVTAPGTDKLGGGRAEGPLDKPGAP
ncbi:MAG: cobaltochelatase subunit CobN, partial [Rhodospirillales bacterium]